MFSRLRFSSSFPVRLTLIGALLSSGMSAAVVPVAQAAFATDNTLPPSSVTAPISETSPSSVDPDQVQLQADGVSYDEINQTITAEGSVEVTQNGRIVQAKKIVYNLPQDRVEAVGDVVMTDITGDVHYADKAVFERQLKDGYVKTLKSLLADGSRVKARDGYKKGNRTVMQKASYTACKECVEHPDKPVLWQIDAAKVTHDNDAHEIRYRDATFRIYDVPVFYTPYFSHSDGTIKQKSGFLPPKFSLNSQLGFGVTSKYYWGISPSEDATIGARVFSKNTPQLLVDYRKRFDHADLEFNSSAVYSADEDPEMRGHFFGKGLWELNDHWRTGFSTELTSDDKYLREYDISSKNVLENQLYAERFEDRDYFVARALAFQDVRVSNRSTDQPNVMPEMQYSAVGTPNAALGGRWNVDVSSLTLIRKGNGQDMMRGSAELGWKRRDVSSLGLVNTLNVSARGDMYQIADRDATTVTSDSGNTLFRFYPLINDTLSYPVAKNLPNAQIVLEPTVAFTMSSRSGSSTSIPNEDSQDVQIDTTNLFDANRFPGQDKVEDGAHVTYGLRSGVYADDGSKGEIFLGQSRRLDSQNNPFPVGSGLSADASDLVGQMILEYQDLYGLNYRNQFSADNFQSERHELDGFVTLGDFTLSTNYVYARGLEGTDIQDSRQQISNALTYRMAKDWELTTAVRYDLSQTESGLRSEYIGLNYMGQCFNVLTTVKRNFTDNNTGDNATEFNIQLGFKNLGSFGTGQQKIKQEYNDN